jgi:hypothetical protein
MFLKNNLNFCEKPFAHFAKKYIHTCFIIRSFYMIYFFTEFNDSLKWIPLFQHASFTHPLWVLNFFPAVWLPSLAVIFKLTGVISALLSALPKSYRAFRVVHFLSIFVTIAMENSFGSVGSYKHIYLWTSFCFAMVPTFSSFLQLPKRKPMLIVIQTFFFAQLLITVFYFLSGFWKFAALLNCFLYTPGECRLDSYLFPSIVAREMIFFGESPTLLFLIFDFPKLSTFLYFCVIAFELFAPAFLISRRGTFLFGAALVCFHISNYLFLSVNFFESLPAICILYVFSYLPKERSQRQVLKTLSSS